MPPKRKAAAKRLGREEGEGRRARAAGAVADHHQAKGKSPASPKKASPPAPPLDEYAALWANAEFVEGGAMGRAGFAAFCASASRSSFEACYLMHLLTPKIDDVMVVCPSEEGFRAVVERRLQCARPADVAAKLRAKRTEFISDAYGNGVEGHEFTLYYKWLYDVGRAIAAANNGVSAEQVRSVPAAEAVMFLRAGLAGWPYMENSRPSATRRRCRRFPGLVGPTRPLRDADDVPRDRRRPLQPGCGGGVAVHDRRLRRVARAAS